MTHSPIRNLTRCALCTALLCLCSWIAIPLPGISITMQTFGLFLTLLLLGGAQGALTILAYLLLGCAGLPVFTGFQGGIGVLLGPTGGYLLGFLICALISWGTKSRIPLSLSLFLGLLGCYVCGTCWYALGYLHSGIHGIPAALMTCVLPYVIPDTVKLLLASRLHHHLRRHLQ